MYLASMQSAQLSLNVCTCIVLLRGSVLIKVDGRTCERADACSYMRAQLSGAAMSLRDVSR